MADLREAHGSALIRRWRFAVAVSRCRCAGADAPALARPPRVAGSVEQTQPVAQERTVAAQRLVAGVPTDR